MDEVERLVSSILIMHTRTGASTCYTCGQMPLGSSFTEHQAAALRKAGLLVAGLPMKDISDAG